MRSRNVKKVTTVAILLLTDIKSWRVIYGTLLRGLHCEQVIINGHNIEYSLLKKRDLLLIFFFFTNAHYQKLNRLLLHLTGNDHQFLWVATFFGASLCRYSRHSMRSGCSSSPRFRRPLLSSHLSKKMKEILSFDVNQQIEG